MLKNERLIKITDCGELDEKKLMHIYSEGNLENTDYFYPDIEDKREAVKRVEKDFCNYIKTEFLNGKNAYYVLEAEGEWVSALRLYLLEDNFYYLEALETSPERRRKGYASRLLTSVTEELNGAKICDCVSKKNAASLGAHKKCGFKIVSENGYDYLQKEYDDHCYGLMYGEE